MTKELLLIQLFLESPHSILIGLCSHFLARDARYCHERLTSFCPPTRIFIPVLIDTFLRHAVLRQQIDEFIFEVTSRVLALPVQSHILPETQLVVVVEDIDGASFCLNHAIILRLAAHLPHGQLLGFSADKISTFFSFPRQIYDGHESSKDPGQLDELKRLHQVLQSERKVRIFYSLALAERLVDGLFGAIELFLDLLSQDVYDCFIRLVFIRLLPKKLNLELGEPRQANQQILYIIIDRSGVFILLL